MPLDWPPKTGLTLCMLMGVLCIIRSRVGLHTKMIVTIPGYILHITRAITQNNRRKGTSVSSSLSASIDKEVLY